MCLCLFLYSFANKKIPYFSRSFLEFFLVVLGMIDPRLNDRPRENVER